MKTLLLVLLFETWAALLGAQVELPAEADLRAQYDTLLSRWGTHKQLPAGLELQALVALSYYPELRDAYIRFEYKKATLPYASKPRFVSLLHPFGKRCYRIIISTQSTALREPTLMKNLPFQAQIGALGHELAHTAYYSKTGSWKLLSDGLRYSSDRFKEKFEKMTDDIAIEHGLDWYIYTWNAAIYSVKKRDGKRANIYYTPEQILERIPHR